MLHSITWGRFFTVFTLLTGLYYLVVFQFVFRKRFFDWLRKRMGLTTLGAVSVGLLRAQDGNQGISQANTMIRGYFDTGTQLLMAIGAVLALIGAVKVFRVWNNDDRGQAYHAAAAWFGSCIFLVLVATIIRSFFGL